ncbi:uncharacterized protein BO88DRAFT_166277 [Aspergillus vadensis CBS 113365]|uniref:Uncharacterized protein n=1 Tax=Aspergillus vadensis (strain CBS 113365 / IMI 142717 / IBT 24658) TaxID=1448311 RepID=A0A319BIN1_ASPVC|nr:hypothetical protein BO88DRAFT_166277 [Aspergillus vadensis CBS 113365]PYH72605.1 hypothetical protein BO88DRAFT_166277 [Aspergillus vadensis CBS 113365]
MPSRPHFPGICLIISFFFFFSTLLIPHTFCAIFHYLFHPYHSYSPYGDTEKRPATAITFILFFYPIFYIFFPSSSYDLSHLPSGMDLLPIPPD